MARYVQQGVQEARRNFADLVAAAEKAEPQTQHTILLKRSKQSAVVVSMDWFRRAAKALGEDVVIDVMAVDEKKR